MLSIQNIECELSYAYLHAVASKAGLNCQWLNRHSDNDGVDAQVEFTGKIPGTYITDVQIRVQLKATVNCGVTNNSHISYPFQGIPQYNKLRLYSGGCHRILIVLCLHESADEWLKCTPEELTMKKAAYWVCLYGAEETTNQTSKTVYLPLDNLLTPSSLKDLMIKIGQNNLPSYELPNQ